MSRPFHCVACTVSAAAYTMLGLADHRRYYGEVVPVPTGSATRRSYTLYMSLRAAITLRNDCAARSNPMTAPHDQSAPQYKTARITLQSITEAISLTLIGER